MTSSSARLEEVTVAILAGGKGTRLQSVVSDRPKPLAEVADRPFLAYQLEQLAAAGIRRVVLCTGYLSEQVTKTFGSSYAGMRLEYSPEPAALGTAGAVRHALSRLTSDPVMVMNGDSYCDADLAAFWQFHCARQAEASVLLTHVDEADRYGQVLLDSEQRVAAFREKAPSQGAGWINAGIYLVARRLLDSIPAGRAVSLEREVFPNWVGGRFYGHRCHARFIDIGTPESYALAASFLAARRGA
ncbi:MAG TPA: nucleotidyltransferase family protein [Pirellulales bacterium]